MWSKLKKLGHTIHEGLSGLFTKKKTHANPSISQDDTGGSMNKVITYFKFRNDDTKYPAKEYPAKLQLHLTTYLQNITAGTIEDQLIDMLYQVMLLKDNNDGTDDRVKNMTEILSNYSLDDHCTYDVVDKLSDRFAHYQTILANDSEYITQKAKLEILQEKTSNNFAKIITGEKPPSSTQGMLDKLKSSTPTEPVQTLQTDLDKLLELEKAVAKKTKAFSMISNLFHVISAKPKKVLENKNKSQLAKKAVATTTKACTANSNGLPFFSQKMKKEDEGGQPRPYAFYCNRRGR